MHCISIDQNSNSLWDTLPKLQALQQAGLKFTHFVEDIDVAFTRVGAHSNEIALTTEQYYPNGNLDWGASLFYMSFLGRCPLNLHDLEKYTGASTTTTAKSLGLTVDQLFAKYSIGDNQQLTAPSYIDANKDIHRLLGDLSTDETGPFIFQLFDCAELDLLECFPEPDAQDRIKIWFTVEREKVREISKESKTLAELYQKWMQTYFSQNCISFTSEFFDTHSTIGEQSFAILHKIVNNYDLFCKIYNDSIEESGVELSPISEGSLPFFAVYHHNDRLVRSPLSLSNDKLISGALEWDKNCSQEQFSSKILALAGKALLLVIISRIEKIGSPLVLPQNGSLYTPAADLLERKMREKGFLCSPSHPIVRTKFNFLRQLEVTNTTFNTPNYFHDFFPKQLSTKKFSKMVPEAIKDAKKSLNDLHDVETRAYIFSKWFPKLSEKIIELKTQKDSYGRIPEKRHLCSSIWKEIKVTEKEFTQRCYERVIRTFHVSQLDYWNSRGALLPWSIAVGGPEFYQHILTNVEIINK